MLHYDLSRFKSDFKTIESTVNCLLKQLDASSESRSHKGCLPEVHDSKGNHHDSIWTTSDALCSIAILINDLPSDESVAKLKNNLNRSAKQTLESLAEAINKYNHLREKTLNFATNSTKANLVQAIDTHDTDNLIDRSIKELLAAHSDYVGISRIYPPDSTRRIHPPRADRLTSSILCYSIRLCKIMVPKLFDSNNNSDCLSADNIKILQDFIEETSNFETSPSAVTFQQTFDYLDKEKIIEKTPDNTYKFTQKIITSLKKNNVILEESRFNSEKEASDKFVAYITGIFKKIGAISTDSSKSERRFWSDIAGDINGFPSEEYTLHALLSMACSTNPNWENISHACGQLSEIYDSSSINSLSTSTQRVLGLSRVLYILKNVDTDSETAKKVIQALTTLMSGAYSQLLLWIIETCINCRVIPAETAPREFSNDFGFEQMPGYDASTIALALLNGRCLLPAKLVINDATGAPHESALRKMTTYKNDKNGEKYFSIDNLVYRFVVSNIISNISIKEKEEGVYLSEHSFNKTSIPVRKAYNWGAAHAISSLSLWLKGKNLWQKEIDGLEIERIKGMEKLHEYYSENPKHNLITSPLLYIALITLCACFVGSSTYLPWILVTLLSLTWIKVISKEYSLKLAYIEDEIEGWQKQAVYVLPAALYCFNLWVVYILTKASSGEEFSLTEHLPEFTLEVLPIAGGVATLLIGYGGLRYTLDKLPKFKAYLFQRLTSFLKISLGKSKPDIVDNILLTNKSIQGSN